MKQETPTPTASDGGMPVSRSYLFLLSASLCVIFVAGGMLSYSYFSAIKKNDQAVVAQTAAAAAAAQLPDVFANVQLLAQSAYVYDLDTHQVLFTLNPDAQRPLASLTKIAMALAVTQALQPDQTITIPYDTSATPSADMLTKGSDWPVQDVLDFTLIMSSNQGADILSAAANDTIHQEYPESPDTSATSSTIWLMNRIVQNLGLSSMYFLNDNGLDLTTTQSGAYGSARDVGTLIAYAASTSLPTFQATIKPSMTFTNTQGQRATAINTDTALDAIPGIVMGKTGYTDLAGGNLAVVFDAGLGHRIVAVVLGSTEDGRFTDMEQLVGASMKAVAQGQ